MKNSTMMINTEQRIGTILIAVVAILSIPLIAMQFTKKVDWTVSDFVIMGTLLLTTGFAIEIVIRNVKTFKARLYLCLAILIALFLIWAELAVGIFGSPFAGS